MPLSYAKFSAVILFAFPLLYLFYPNFTLAKFCLMNHRNWFCEERKNQFQSENDCLNIGLNPSKRSALHQSGVIFDVYLDENAGYLNIENLSEGIGKE